MEVFLKSKKKSLEEMSLGEDFWTKFKFFNKINLNNMYIIIEFTMKLEGNGLIPTIQKEKKRVNGLI